MNAPNTIDDWFALTSFRRGPFEGNRVDDHGLIFGVGSRHLLSSDAKDPQGLLLHEVGHFLEINEARCFRYGWGLEMHKVEICGRECEDMFTFAACAREVRAMAIQRVLHHHFGASFDDAYWPMLIEKWVPGSGHAGAYYNDPTLEWPHENAAGRRIERMSTDIVERSQSHRIEDLWTLWLHRSKLHDERFGG